MHELAFVTGLSFSVGVFRGEGMAARVFRRFARCFRTVLDPQLDLGRGVEPEGLCDLLQIQLLHLEAVLQAVRRVGVDVAPVRVPAAPVQVVVLFDQPLQLGLDVGHLVLRKRVLVRCHV